MQEPEFFRPPSFILEQRVLAPHVQLLIPKDRYSELADARQLLSDALEFEQRYELLLGNFIAMELFMSETGLRARLEQRHEYEDFAELLGDASRHVVNLLTAMRAYVDQVPRDFKGLRVDKGLFSELVDEELHAAYDRSYEYRFMNDWVDSVKFNVQKRVLVQDRGFKASVLAESSDEVDVRRAARGSIHQLGLVHTALRAAVEPEVAQARKTISGAIDEYKSAGAESAIGLCAVQLGTHGREIPIFLDWDDVRKKLISKNRFAVRLWPRKTPDSPSSDDVRGIRERAGHDQAAAARLAFVPKRRWSDYEEGLPMPRAHFILYQLQTGEHPTHQIVPKEPTE